ncbi:hypothetical protein ABTY64_23350, partial [Streptomyces albidoflavus]
MTGATEDGAAERPRRTRQQRKQVLLRLDPLVHDALARWAADELRSTNAQIEPVGIVIESLRQLSVVKGLLGTGMVLGL